MSSVRPPPAPAPRSAGTNELAHDQRRGRDLHERGERGGLPRLDEVDDAEQEDRPVAELEHVSDLDRRRNVRDTEVVARAAVGANRNADHAGIVPRLSVRIQWRQRLRHGGPVCMNTHWTDPFCGFERFERLLASP